MKCLLTKETDKPKILFNKFLLLITGMCQHGTCMNTVGSFRCECETGYVYDETSHQCIDRNECVMSNGGLGVCLGNARCVNSPGSYECVCPEGYRLDHSGTFSK